MNLNEAAKQSYTDILTVVRKVFAETTRKIAANEKVAVETKQLAEGIIEACKTDRAYQSKHFKFVPQVNAHIAGLTELHSLASQALPATEEECIQLGSRIHLAIDTIEYGFDCIPEGLEIEQPLYQALIRGIDYPGEFSDALTEVSASLSKAAELLRSAEGGVNVSWVQWYINGSFYIYFHGLDEESRQRLMAAFDACVDKEELSRLQLSLRCG